MLGGWVRPILTSTHLYWIQASRDPKHRFGSTGFGSSLMSYDFATGTVRALYTGLTEALVAYGDLVLFTGVPPGSKPASTGAGPAQRVLAVRQSSGRLVPAPSGLTAAADGASVMTTNGDLVVWDTTNGGARGWRPAWGRSVDLLPDVMSAWPGFPADRSAVDQPHLSGDLLVWSATQTYVLDLRTDTLTRLTTKHGGQDVAGSNLELWEYVHDVAPPPGQALEISSYVVDLSHLAPLPGCTH
jgi:hypothetical protein